MKEYRTLAVLERPRRIQENTLPKKDIIVKKLKWKEEQVDGGFLRKPTYELINITKKINETKKLLKQDTLQEKLNSITKIATSK